MEKWNELCFILSESIPSNASEQLFELKVIQAFEKLKWSEFNNEIVVRESIHIGAANRISPDLVLKSKEKGSLFLVEVKKPSLDISNSNYENQLSSYLGVFRLELGLLIGNKIQVYIDGKLFNKNGIILIEEIEFKRDSDKGFKFVELFQKDSYDFENIKKYAIRKIQLLEERETIKTLKRKLLSNNYNEVIKNSFKSELLKDYREETVDKVLSELEIKIIDKNMNPQTTGNFENKNVEYSPFVKQTTFDKNSDQLPIGRYVRETLNQDEIEKVQRKLPRWFKNPNLICSQILIAFLEMKKNSVDYESLSHECKHIKTFKTNFHQMINFSERNHGKVFEKTNSIITIWNPVKENVMSEYEKYLKSKTLSL